jgi:AraC family transcriptional regulator
MEYTEAHKPAMKFVGYGVNTSMQNAGQDCPGVWSTFMKNYKGIENYIGGMKNYGVVTNADSKECTFRYIASAEVSEFGDMPEGSEKIEIPESDYLIFIHRGKLETLGNTYGSIMEDIPRLGKRQRTDFWVELYDKRWTGDKDEAEFEIWIPVE